MSTEKQRITRHYSRGEATARARPTSAEGHGPALSVWPTVGSGTGPERPPCTRAPAAVSAPTLPGQRRAAGAGTSGAGARPSCAQGAWGLRPALEGAGQSADLALPLGLTATSLSFHYTPGGGAHPQLKSKAGPGGPQGQRSTQTPACPEGHVGEAHCHLCLSHTWSRDEPADENITVKPLTQRQ